MRPESYQEPGNDALFLERPRKILIRYIGVLHFGPQFNDDLRSVLYRDLLGIDDQDIMGEELPRGPLRATIPVRRGRL
jgi:hypothetical protein